MDFGVGDNNARPRGVLDRKLRLPRLACFGVEGLEQLLRRNVQRFRGGLVFKAHRLVYHSTLGWRVIKKKNARPRGILDRKLRLPCLACFAREALEFRV